MKYRALVFGLVIAVLAACTGTDGNAGELSVTDVWGRSSPMAAQNGAFYMVFANDSGQDDKLLGVDSEACATVEVHEMYAMENDVMGMRPVPGGFIALPAGETVELKPGGLHVMCIDKQVPFDVGDSIPLVLRFEGAGEMQLTAEIRDAEMGNVEMDQ